MYKYNTLTLLDYGAEAKESEEDFDKTKAEFIKAINFGSKSESIPVVTIKVTGMTRFELLKKISAKQPLSDTEQTEWQRSLTRLDEVCALAAEKNMSVWIDAEETWIQQAVDDAADAMMAKYNKQKQIGRAHV